MAAYSTIVSKQFAPKLDQKPTPARSIAGKTKHIGSDGSTYQKVHVELHALGLAERRTGNTACGKQDVLLVERRIEFTTKTKKQ